MSAGSEDADEEITCWLMALDGASQFKSASEPFETKADQTTPISQYKRSIFSPPRRFTCAIAD